MVFRKFFGQSPRNGIVHKDVKDPKALFYNERLEKGVFTFPDASGSCAEVEAPDLALLLEGIDLRGAKRRERFVPRREIVPAGG